MGDQTNISWCDATHNFWRGCTKVSPGCAHCYAETLVTTRLASEHYEVATSEASKRTSRHFSKTAGGHSTSGIKFWGKGSPRIRAVDFNAPLRWNKKPWACSGCEKFFAERDAHGCGQDAIEAIEMFHRRRVFSLSLGDIWDDEVPDEWLADALDIVRRCLDLDFLLLTKRPELFDYRLAAARRFAKSDNQHKWIVDWQTGKAPHNVWIGASVEDQQRADERIPELLKIPAAIRFLSVEPMLGAIDLRWLDVRYVGGVGKSKIDWVIFGGESGPGARPCNVEWIRDGLRQCQAAHVAAFVKQLGKFPYEGTSPHSSGPDAVKCNLYALEDKKGGAIEEWPGGLRIREWPKTKPEVK